MLSLGAKPHYFSSKRPPIQTLFLRNSSPSLDFCYYYSLVLVFVAMYSLVSAAASMCRAFWVFFYLLSLLRFVLSLLLEDPLCVLIRQKRRLTQFPSLSWITKFPDVTPPPLSTYQQS